tara:strand:- start:3869 stop:5644 length:1776 start_codon:yes stop_codon:yes gene_type:complete
MSYFVADDKLPVLQQQISIPSENGLNYNSTQTIEINIPSNTKFINPRECYLQFDVKLSNDETAGYGRLRTQLDAETGAQCLIKDLRIYDGNKNQLLEEILDYNVMCAMKYDYETNESLKNKRALLEGATISEVPECRGTRGSTKTQCNQFFNSPYYTQDYSNPQITDFSNGANMRTAKVCLPLNTGIFQNEAIFPTMLTNGLHISITLEEDRKVFRMLDGVALDRRTTLNPIFFSSNGCATTGGVDDGDDMKEFYTYTANNQISATNSPFCVGQKVSFFDTTAKLPMTFQVSGGGAATTPTIARIEDGTGTEAGLVKYTFSASVQVQQDLVTDGRWVMYDESINSLATAFNATYKVSNVQMVLQQITADNRYEAGMLKKMNEGGVITYDFLSVTNYRYSQLANDRVANIRLPLNNSRMKSIISVPTDASVYDMRDALCGARDGGSATYIYAPTANRDLYSYSNRSGLVGISDEITNYSWFYDGRLQPSRRVDLRQTSTRSSISAQGLIELDKALTAADIETHSMAKYSENFMIGRAVAIGKNNVYDARNKDFNLQVNYQQTDAPTKPKLWHNFVYHIRRLNIQGENISVEV